MPSDNAAPCLCTCRLRQPATHTCIILQVVPPPQSDIQPQPLIIAAQPQMPQQPQFVASQFMPQQQMLATQPSFVAAQPRMTYVAGGTPTFVAAQPTLAYNSGTFGGFAGYGLGGRYGKGL